MYKALLFFYYKVGHTVVIKEQENQKSHVQNLSCVNLLLFFHLGFFLRCSSTTEVLSSSYRKTPWSLYYRRRPHFILQPHFSIWRTWRAVISLPKLIISLRKAQNLQLAAHIINILCLKTISACKQFQLSFNAAHDFSHLCPPPMIKLIGAQHRVLVIYSFEQPKQPNPAIFERLVSWQLEGIAFRRSLPFFPQPPAP